MSTVVADALRWTRVYIARPADLLKPEFEAGEAHNSPGVPGKIFELTLLDCQRDSLGVCEVKLVLHGDRIVTIEPDGGAPALDRVAAEVQRSSPGTEPPLAVGPAIVNAGYAAIRQSLAKIEEDIREAHQATSTFGGTGSDTQLVGVSDLPAVSALLAEIDTALSHVSHALGQLMRYARHINHEGARVGGLEPRFAADLLTEGESLSRRLEFIVDRHRFHAQSSAQRVSTSDLNVIKVFSVLWAILIPGTTLINWYGQNFEFMPELSWPYTATVQLIGVFVLAALPIYVIKRAGQLR